jgi:hypothetical protein
MTGGLAAKTAMADPLLSAAASVLSLEAGAIIDEELQPAGPIVLLPAVPSQSLEADEGGVQVLMETPAIFELTADSEVALELVMDELLPELLT